MDEKGKRTKNVLDASDEIWVTRSRIQCLGFMFTRMACSGADDEERGLFDGLAFIIDDIDAHLEKAESLL